MKTQEQLIAESLEQVEESLEQVERCINDLDEALDSYYQNLLLRLCLMKSHPDCHPNIMQAIVDLEAELSDFKKRVC